MILRYSYPIKATTDKTNDNSCKTKSHLITFCHITRVFLSSYPTVTCPNTLTSHTEWRVNSMKAFYVLARITARDYYFTIVLYQKNWCKIGNNTIIWKKKYLQWRRKLF